MEVASNETLLLVEQQYILSVPISSAIWFITILSSYLSFLKYLAVPFPTGPLYYKSSEFQDDLPKALGALGNEFAISENLLPLLG